MPEENYSVSTTWSSVVLTKLTNHECIYKFHDTVNAKQQALCHAQHNADNQPRG